MFYLCLLVLWVLFTAKGHLDNPSLNMSDVFLGSLIPAFVITAALAGGVGCPQSIPASVGRATMQFISAVREYLYGLKVKLLAVLIFALGALEVIDPNAIVLILGPQSKGYITIVMAVAMYVMRNMTHESAKPIKEVFNTEGLRGRK